MAGHNRHIKGCYNTITVDVKGNVVVEPGDIMFRMGAGGMTGASTTADNYGYPVSSLANAASTLTALMGRLATNFIGVAMEGSPSGTTEKVTVATDGVFRYPQYRKSAVTVGALVSDK